MPSPFPGMDPYLEAPDIWPDLHEHFASEVGNQLNLALPAPYYARLEMRPEIGIVEEAGVRQTIVPDVAIVRHPRIPPGGAATAVLDQPRTTLSPHVEFVIRHEPQRHQWVEVRDTSRGHKLITLIEIVSPSNKRMGQDRDAYQQKQQEVLASDDHLIEIDLLRCGRRLAPRDELIAFMDQREPPPDYVVLVSRAWHRSERSEGYHFYPIALRDALPCIPVPLRQSEPDFPLDLQYVFNQAYDRGPYRRGAVDYHQSPNPPLRAEDAAWAAELIQGTWPAP